MKITVLFGSPKKDGNTAKLLELFLSGLKSFCEKSLYAKKPTVRIIYAYDAMVSACEDCGYCTAKHGSCVHGDMNGIKKDILSSDLVIIASPAYIYSFPAPLKAILDRFQCFFDKESLFDENAKKTGTCKGVLLATSGSSGKFSFEFMEKQARMAFLMLNIEYIASLNVANTDAGESIKIDNSKANKLYSQLF